MSFFKKIKHYPKFAILILTILIAYYFFNKGHLLPAFQFILSLGYLGTFLLGMFWSYGFTAAPATVFLILMGNSQNIYLTGIIASIGALVSDLILFSVIRFSFKDEVDNFSQEKKIIFLHKKIDHYASPRLHRYLLLAFAGLIIASPLPDEIGVSILAASRAISLKFFPLFSIFFNLIGIFTLLFIGKGI